MVIIRAIHLIFQKYEKKCDYGQHKIGKINRLKMAKETNYVGYSPSLGQCLK